jgi:GT2 family glycosyltransferase
VKAGFEPPLPMPAEKQVSQAPPDLDTLVNLARPLEALSRRAMPVEGAIAPRTSIVVCTRNRPESLENCLSSIRRLSPAAHDVVVVDNDPSSGLTRRVTDRFSEVRYVPENRPGLSAARNAGVRHSVGEIVAFTDDDVTVHPHWIGAIHEGFRDPAVIAVTGLVLPAELRTRAQYVFQAEALGWGWGYRAMDFDRVFFDSTKRVGVPAWRLGAGANMAFRREAFERVGLFDERLGAGASGCSEDSELWYRLLAEGYRCRYEPGAVVFHYHRRDWQGLCDQLYSYMRGHVAALFVQFDRYGHAGNLYRAFFAVPRYLARISYRAARQRIGRLVYDSGTEGLTQPLMPQIRGALSGYAYYLRHRHQPLMTRIPGAEEPAIHPGADAEIKREDVSGSASGRAAVHARES